MNWWTLIAVAFRLFGLFGWADKLTERAASKRQEKQQADAPLTDEEEIDALTRLPRR